MKIWVVLPAYNERPALPALVASLTEHLQDQGRPYTLLVVNDGSTDGTKEWLDQSQGKYRALIPIHQYPNRGLAETLRHGLLFAIKNATPDDVIFTMDADDTHPPGLMPRMMRAMQEGNEIVIASRYREGSSVVGLAWHRRVLSYGASWLFRLLFPIRGVRDYTCGYRAYRASVLQNLVKKTGEQFITERGFSCMVDLLLRLRADSPVMTEVPLVLRYDQKQGPSKMQVGQTVRDTLALAVRRRLNVRPPRQTPPTADRPGPQPQL